MDTSVIKAIAIKSHVGGAPIAFPTPLPALGGAVTWTGWTTIGSKQQHSHDADLDGESVDVTPMRELVKLRAPKSLTTEEVALLSNGIDEITFTVYGTKETAMSIDSTIAATLQVSERGSTITYKSMAIEIAGKGAFYYPKVAVFVNSTGGSVSEAVKMEVTCIVLGTSDVPSGEQFKNFV